MKIKPEVLLGSKKNISFNKILITGSDESYIAYLKNHIIEDFKKRNFFVDFSNNYNINSMGNLFCADFEPCEDDHRKSMITAVEQNFLWLPLRVGNKLINPSRRIVSSIIAIRSMFLFSFLKY